QAPGLKAVQAGLLAAIFFTLTAGAGGALILGLAVLVMPLWHLRLPWQEPAPEVAVNMTSVAASPTTRPKEPIAQVTAVAASAAAPTEAPASAPPPPAPV